MEKFKFEKLEVYQKTLQVAYNQKYISNFEYLQLYKDLQEISKMLNGLMKSLI